MTVSLSSAQLLNSER